jgi:hypothetical protein
VIPGYAGTLNTIARKPGHDKDTAAQALNLSPRIAIVFSRVRAKFIEAGKKPIRRPI